MLADPWSVAPPRDLPCRTQSGAGFVYHPESPDADREMHALVFGLPIMSAVQPGDWAAPGPPTVYSFVRSQPQRCLKPLGGVLLCLRRRHHEGTCSPNPQFTDLPEVMASMREQPAEEGWCRRRLAGTGGDYCRRPRGHEGRCGPLPFTTDLSADYTKGWAEDAWRRYREISGEDVVDVPWVTADGRSIIEGPGGRIELRESLAEACEGIWRAHSAESGGMFEWWPARAFGVALRRFRPRRTRRGEFGGVRARHGGPWQVDAASAAMAREVERVVMAVAAKIEERAIAREQWRS